KEDRGPLGPRSGIATRGFSLELVVDEPVRGTEDVRHVPLQVSEAVHRRDVERDLHTGRRASAGGRNRANHDYGEAGDRRVPGAAHVRAAREGDNGSVLVLGLHRAGGRRARGAAHRLTEGEAEGVTELCTTGVVEAPVRGPEVVRDTRVRQRWRREVSRATHERDAGRV